METNKMKGYNQLKWLWHRIAYWGDKTLTLIFYLVFGLVILSWKLSGWLLRKTWSLLNYIYGSYQDWRLFRKIKRETPIYKALNETLEYRTNTRTEK